jgi:hypothetical protein
MDRELPSPKRKDAHDRIAQKAYRRLRLRYAQLIEAEEEARQYKVHADLLREWPLVIGRASLSESQARDSSTQDRGKSTGNGSGREDKAGRGAGDGRIIAPHLRAYRLAVTDLFVEKAIVCLEETSSAYRWKGLLAYILAFGFIGFGVALSVWGGPSSRNSPATLGITLSSSQQLGVLLMRSFTMYGMIVLAAVSLWRFGKAMLDQAERLMERRHALRQGRLFVHLVDGCLRVEEMEKAFNWNQSQSNAFGHMKTEAQAPLGAITAETIRSFAEIAKAIQAAKSSTDDAGK